MKYRVFQSTRFRKSLKKMLARGKDGAKLEAVVAKLANGESLPPANRDHALTGNWTNHRECHIAPNWLLIYQIKDDILVLELTRTGSHSDLF